MDLRCDNSILFGVIEDGVIEVKCRSSRCGAGNGVVVLHRFNLTDGRLVSTATYKNPVKEKTG